jgi:DNA-binding beta-propeller fold protein YncE
MNIISLMDEKVIKQINFDVNPEQIIIDNNNKIAYITSSSNSSVYILSLETMTLKKQLKINGKCEKFTLSQDCSKMFYVDRNTNDIWVIELDNNYLLKNIGSFPNVSKIAYQNGKIYVISRTKNRIAIVDYDTLEFLSEFEVCEKPVDLYANNNELYILGAQDNIIEVMDTQTDTITDKLYLNTNAFATKITPIENSNMIMITNALSGLYSIVDTDLKEVIKTSPLDVPVRVMAVTDKVKTIK